MRADGVMQFHNAYRVNSYPFKSIGEAESMKNDYKLAGFVIEKGVVQYKFHIIFLRSQT
jgi:hypothetical protein